MSEFFNRQIAVLRQIVDDYRVGKLPLNSLIQRIQGIGDVLEIEAWDESVFPIVWSMEQINAFALEEKKGLTEVDKISVENSLRDLEAIINHFESSEA